VPVFYAEKDTRTPTRIALMALAANFALNLALIGPLAHIGLALATSLAAWLQTGLLAYRLRGRGRLPSSLIRRLPLASILAASITMAAALLGVRLLLRIWALDAVTAVVLTVATGLTVYGLAAWLFGLHRRLPGMRRPAPSA